MTMHNDILDISCRPGGAKPILFVAQEFVPVGLDYSIKSLQRTLRMLMKRYCDGDECSAAFI